MECMKQMAEALNLRATNWKTVPTVPGTYWWYFPIECLERFRIIELCALEVLNLRRSPSGKVCLYHGMATNLAQRVKWHAAQRLTLGALRSGFLSTFRFSLLALNEFDYLAGEAALNEFMDGLAFDWQAAKTVEDAEKAEAAELAGEFHYPLNIRHNVRPELARYTRHLKSVRRIYKQRYR
jgi:hypothetical protein